MNELPSTQIAIVGAGIGGCIAAITLSARYKVTLIDKHAEPIARVGECLPPASRRILHTLGLLPDFEQAGHITSLGMQSYWGSEQLQFVDNLSNPDGFGWHLDRQAFEQQLRDAAIARGVTLLAPMQLESSRAINGDDSGGWCLTIANSHNRMTLKSDVVIDASGRHCVFARQRGVLRKQFDKLVSCWMTVARKPERMMGLIAPTEQGWWYAAPLAISTTNSTQQVVSFQTDADLLPREFGQSPTAFMREAASLEGFQPIFEGLNSDDYQWHGKVAANSSILTQVADRNWFAIGDAALSFDPLSSQGMFNSMATAMQLSDLLLANGLENAGTSQQYKAQVAKVLHYYQHHKTLYYQQEKRWQHQAFWARR